jgi:uncharacterized protein (DUF1786 family)
MKILTVDVGTGTQDIYLYDSELDLENGFKLVVPSPTMIIHRRIKDATRRGEAILLTGVIMGGGQASGQLRTPALDCRFLLHLRQRARSMMIWRQLRRSASRS